MPDSTEQAKPSFHAPRYWPTWIGFWLLRLLSFLPFKAQLRLGRSVGRLALKLSPKRAQVTRRNLQTCFPEYDADWIEDTVTRHFENLGMGVFEMAMAWYRPQRLKGRWRFNGIEHLSANTPGSVILITGHFGALEVGGTALKSEGLIFDAVYREDRSPLVTELTRRGRERSGRQTIEKSNIKQMVRSLRDGIPVWYAPDQSYRRKHSAMINFFGEPAMTNTATSNLDVITRQVRASVRIKADDSRLPHRSSPSPRQTQSKTRIDWCVSLRIRFGAHPTSTSGFTENSKADRRTTPTSMPICSRSLAHANGVRPSALRQRRRAL